MFVRLTRWQLLWLALWPPAKRAWEARLRQGIAWSVAHPEAAIVFHEPGCQHRDVCTCGTAVSE
jgi:hypothetical protein